MSIQRFYRSAVMVFAVMASGTYTHSVSAISEGYRAKLQRQHCTQVEDAAGECDKVQHKDIATSLRGQPLSAAIQRLKAAGYQSRNPHTWIRTTPFDSITLIADGEGIVREVHHQ